LFLLLLELVGITVVLAQQVALTKHHFGAMNNIDIIPQHVHLPSLHLMGRQQINHPKPGNAIAISDPNEQPNPKILVPLDECPTTLC
jgi:hypothetical protein